MVKLADLLHAVGLERQAGIQDVSLTALCYDSRQCKENCAFFAFGGIHTDGHNYIMQAIANGAVCIFSQKEVKDKEEGILYLTTTNPRSLFAKMCAAFYDYPSNNLKLIGVTGTDGKSTTCDYLYQLLCNEGIKAGILGTISMDDGTGKRPSPYRQSTPEADSLQQYLKRCVDNGLTHVILECTSHALSKEYDRLSTLRYDLAIVTTVTSEHLEFHKTHEAYVDAKCNLVRNLKEHGLFVSTTDNPSLEAFLTLVKPSQKVAILKRDIPYTLTEQDSGHFSCTVENTTVLLDLALPCLAGNALLAAKGASFLLDKPLCQMMLGLKNLKSVTGRMQYIENSLGLSIIIDFAHTEDAYQKLFSFLATKRPRGRIIALFGCAGERDTSKRAPMGFIAATFADILILTEEDPRNEGNDTIFCDLLQNIPPSVKETIIIEKIPDREKAIEKAFSLSQNGDTLLFLGKGHETSIETIEGKRLWNEEEHVRNALQNYQKLQGDTP
jgi:UDP-N-acetylmuramoyl-L-alanyl-D-glutamate--2,6-diaminopimelate ligase